ncbi:MAG: hypothetical protein ACOYBF_06200, partial [Bilifractor porci]
KKSKKAAEFLLFMKKSRRGKLRRLFRKDSIFCKGSMRIPEPLTVCKVFLLWTESTGGNR